LELVNTVATLGTFLVIAATAMAAIVQLRHARSSNQIAALNELIEVQQTPDYKAARHFVHTALPEMLKDPAFRFDLSRYANEEKLNSEAEHHIAKITTIGDFYENMGLLVKRGFIDRDSTLDAWSYHVATEWERLAPVVLRLRRGTAGNALYENFEYLVVLAQDWMATYPKGTYPAGVRRIAIEDEWSEADRQYAASSATP